MKHTYKNTFHTGLKKDGPEYITTEKNPIEYRGYQIFNEHKDSFHVVKDGVCIEMKSLLSSAKEAVDRRIIRHYRKVVKDGLSYHFAGTSGGWNVPKNCPFMQEFLSNVQSLCESVEDEFIGRF